MTCKNCGAQLEDGTKFCAECGTKVEEIAQVVNEVSNDTTPAELSKVADSISPVDAPIEPVSSVEPVPAVEPVSPVEPVPTVTPVEQTVNSYNSNASSAESGEKHKKSFVGPIVGIIALLLIAGGIYFCFFNNKNKVVKDLINNAYNKLEGLTVSDGFDFEKDSVLINGNLTITSNLPELNSLNGEKFKYTVGIDYPNKKMEYGFALEENGSNIFDVAAYLLDNKGYVSLKDNFDKLLKFDVEEMEDIFSMASTSTLTESDIKYVTKAYKDILIKSLKGNDFDKSNATIVLDGKNTKVTKLTYNLTGSRLQTLVNDIIDGTLKDSKLLDILSKATGTSVDEIKSDLQMSKIDGLYDDTEMVSFDIYTKGFNNTFVGMDIQGIIQIRKNSDNVTIEAGMGTEKITLTIKKISDENVVIELNSAIEGLEFKGSLNITFKETSTNTYEGSIVFKLNFDGTELTITNNFTEVIGATIADIDVTGAVDIDSLTPEEENRITENLEKNIMNSNLYKLVEDLSELFNSYSSGYAGGYNTDYDLNYDSDFEFNYDSDFEFNYDSDFDL